MVENEDRSSPSEPNRYLGFVPNTVAREA